MSMNNKRFIKSNIISNMNIKSILLISILIAVMVFNSGCIDEVTETLSGGDSDSFDKKGTDELQKDNDEPSEETLAIDAFLSNLSNLDVDFDSGTFSASDTDNDGKDDIYSYTFEKEDVAEGLSLERKVEYENTDEGLMGSLTLDFENTWGEDDTKSYTHRETIPKSFAGNVDDLKFSVEPDRIINPDPEVEWEITRIMAESLVSVFCIIIEAEKAAAASAHDREVPDDRIAAIEIANMFDLPYVPGYASDKSRQDALTKAENTGMSVALGTVLENIDKLGAAYGFHKCARMDDKREQHICLMALIAKYPGRMPEYICDNFDAATRTFAPFSFASNAACKSVISGDINDCIRSFNIVGHELSKEQKERYCRMQVFNFYATRCDNIQDPQTKKDCLFLSAIESGSEDACKSKYVGLSERQRKICLAMNTQNISYCREMKDEEDWKNCCELMNPDLKEDCLKKEECDSEHLSLCDNEKDCGDAGGYWYNSQCNKEEEEKEDSKDEKEEQKQDECGGLGQECCSCDMFKQKCHNDEDGQRLTCDVLAKPKICVKCGGVDQRICWVKNDNCGYNPPDLESCDPGLKHCYDDSSELVCMSCGCDNQKPCSEGTACFSGLVLIKGYCVGPRCSTDKGLYGSRKCTSDEQCANECPWMTCLDNGYCSKP